MKRLLFLVFIITASCNNTPRPDYLDTESWSDDDSGCTGYRSELVEAHPELLDDLKGMSEDVILKWLGKPEKNELYSRSQQFYIYSLDPTENCEGINTDGSRYLQIRFSATGRAQEVMIYEK